MARRSHGNVVSTAFLLLTFVTLVVAVGCIREDDLTLEQRSHQLGGQLMCPVCDGQTIDGSNAQIAQDMRAKVRELLETGVTNAEVKDYFVVRYGEEILAAPEGGGFNIIAWVVPVFVAFGGIGIALLTVRNLKKSNARSGAMATAETGTGASHGGLDKYLAQVDRDLGTTNMPTGSESKSTGSDLEQPGPEPKAAP